MRFRRVVNGIIEVDDVNELKGRYFCSQHTDCKTCSLYKIYNEDNEDNLTCNEFCEKYLDRALAIMGYERVEDNPTSNVPKYTEAEAYLGWHRQLQGQHMVNHDNLTKRVAVLEKAVLSLTDQVGIMDRLGGPLLIDRIREVEQRINAIERAVRLSKDEDWGDETE